MPSQPGADLIIAAAVGIAVISIVLLAVSRAAAARSSRAMSGRVEELSSEVETLRGARLEAERASAADRARAERVAELESQLADGDRKLEEVREAKAVADAALAAARSVLERVETNVSDVSARLAASEQTVASLRESLAAARDEKASADEELSASAEALRRSEETTGELRGRLAHVDAQLAEASQRIMQIMSEKTAAERAVAEKATLIERLEKMDGERLAALDRANAGLEAARGEVTALKTQTATLRETLEQERRQAEEKLALLAEAREEMSRQFSVLAEGIMQRHGESFTKANKDQIETLLGPLRERLKEFEEKVATTHTESVKERATLAEQIRQIAETGATMSRETKELTEALRGSSQTQGAWGEMILDTILERSGLRAGEHYTRQETVTDDEGARLRPDVVIALPGTQKVVVDSKVSLTAFDAMVNAATPEERDGHLQRHLASVRSHIGSLGAKRYQMAVGGTLDYVVMFVPIEGALSAAMQADPALAAHAVEQNVVITTPTTLMIALRTIANIWQVETRNRNAEDIARRAGHLYDKFVGFIVDMQAIGGGIDKVRVQFDNAMGKLSTGNGNLVRQAELLRSLGARSSKVLPAAVLAAAAASPEELAADHARSSDAVVSEEVAGAEPESEPEPQAVAG